MKKQLKKCDQQNPPEVTNLLTKSEIKERLKEVELIDLTTQATFLDPRFKKYGFSSDITYEGTLQNIKSKISAFHMNEVPISLDPAATGLTINEKRSRLKPEKASQFIFLNHNM